MEKTENTTVPTKGINIHDASIGIGRVVPFLHDFPKLGIEEVFLVGNDWGATIAWYFCLLGLDWAEALVNMIVAFRPRNLAMQPLDALGALYGDDYYTCRLQGWTNIIEEHEQDQELMDQIICMACRSEPCVCQIEEPSWAPAMMDRVTGMVARDKNHACIICWSLGNEAGNGPNHSASAGGPLKTNSRYFIHFIALFWDQSVVLVCSLGLSFFQLEVEQECAPVSFMFRVGILRNKFISKVLVFSSNEVVREKYYAC